MDTFSHTDLSHSCEYKYLCASCKDEIFIVSGLESCRNDSESQSCPIGNNRKANNISRIEDSGRSFRRTNHQTPHSSDHVAVKGSGNLGSSFGGVVFKQSNLADNRKTSRSHECRTPDNDANQSSVQQINNTASTEHRPRQNYPFTNKRCIMLKGGIDRQMVCSDNKLEKTELTECVVFCGRYSDVETPSNVPRHQTQSVDAAVTACSEKIRENLCYFQHGSSESEDQTCPEEDLDYLMRLNMADGEYFNGQDCGRECFGRRIYSGRNSLDSSASVASDNVFLSGQSAVGSSSLSDITSVSSISSCQSSTRGTTTSRMRFALRHGAHSLDNGATEYLTPRQRGEKEIKLLRKERAQLLREKEETEAEMTSLRTCLQAMKEQMDREKEKQLADVMDRLKVSEREKFELTEELCKSQEELTVMDTKYTELKREMTDKEEKCEEYFLDMYKKGQLAAMFEREQELEMLASTQRSSVTVRELTRKLSRTELELARWQGLKLGESYFNSDTPGTQSEATLGFLKDSFFHFLTDKSDTELHLRAMIRIFKYSESQTNKIRKGLEECKHLDKRKVILK